MREEEIYLIRIENKETVIYCKKRQYISKKRLCELEKNLKILFHMGIGNAVFLIISFSVGWISLSWGVKGCILAVCIEVLITFGLWLIFALYYKNLAKKMNKKLQARNSNYSD